MNSLTQFPFVEGEIPGGYEIAPPYVTVVCSRFPGGTARPGVPRVNHGMESNQWGKRDVADQAGVGYRAA
jgi:hypothetical protein